VTSNATPTVVAVAVAYLLLMIGIGVWSARRTRTTRDFFIAGQRVGLLVTGLGTMSAAFSGFVFLGGPGLTYRIGVASLWIVLPVSYTAGLLCWVLARRLRALAGSGEIYTIPDAIRRRFESPTAAGAAAVAIGAGAIGYLAAQLLAVARLLQVSLGVPSLGAAIAIGLTVIVLYSTIGGMVAGAYTDLAQGLLMLFAAVFVFFHAIDVVGGWGPLTDAIVGSDAFGSGFLEPFGKIAPLSAFGFFFVFGVGVLGQPQMLHKFYMIDDPRKLRWMPLILGGSQVVCLLIWIGVGLAVPALVAQGRLAPLTVPDEATPIFLLQFAPELLVGLALAAALAAIMSTADSFLNIAAAAFARDLPRALGRPLSNELFWARVFVPTIGIAAAAVAVSYDDLIALLGTLAFGTFAAALAPTLAVGLNWRPVTARAAVASIGTGLGLNLGLEALARQPWFASPLPDGVIPSAVALAASFLVLVAFSLIPNRLAEKGTPVRYG
jgi:Na+/proline symporter